MGHVVPLEKTVEIKGFQEIEGALWESVMSFSAQ